MDFTDKQLDYFPFPVTGKVDYLAKYPSLKNYKEITDYVSGKLFFDSFDTDRKKKKKKDDEEDVKSTLLNFDTLFRYVVLIYTTNTPLMNIKDYVERKNKAFDMAEVPEGFRKPLMECSDRYCNQVIIAYLRMMKNAKWTRLMVWVEAFYLQSARLQSGTTEPGERTEHLMRNIKDLEGDIDTLVSDLTNQEQSYRIKDEVMQAVEDKHNELSVEHIARLRAEGNDPTRKWNPYAESAGQV